MMDFFDPRISSAPISKKEIRFECVKLVEIYARIIWHLARAFFLHPFISHTSLLYRFCLRLSRLSLTGCETEIRIFLHLIFNIPFLDATRRLGPFNMERSIIFCHVIVRVLLVLLYRYFLALFSQKLDDTPEVLPFLPPAPRVRSTDGRDKRNSALTNEDCR